MDISLSLYSDVCLASLPDTIAMMGGFATLNEGTSSGNTSSGSSSSIGPGYSNKRRRKEMSMKDSGNSSSSGSEDKKLMDRERNRQQARKSRNLKKQCTEKMQHQLNQLHRETEKAEVKDKKTAKDIAGRRQERQKTLRKMFDLRAIGCTDESSWLEVLSPDVCVTMPITPYRHFNPVDVVNNKRVLLGINGMISDTQSLTVTRDQIGLKTRSDEGPVSVKYTLGSEGNSNGNCGVEYFNEDGIMSTFRMRTLDAMSHGASDECEKRGMVRARFNSDCKIEELDMTFDAIAFYHQLMRAADKKVFPVVPNTLESALKDQKSAIVVTTPTHPFRITHINKAWTELCGFELEECQGKSLSILQGPETDMSRVNNLCSLTQKGYPTSMVVTNHNKKGEHFRNHLRCYPVVSDEPGQISHVVGMLTPIPPDMESGEPPRVDILPIVEAF